MIKDAKAIRPEQVPQDLQHRDGQIDQLTMALRPLLDDRHGEHGLITGPSGAGKTTLARYVVEELKSESVDL